MKHDTLGEAGFSYAPCRYGTSRIFFRGPRRPLDGKYIAFIGGNETYGKFIERPFPALVEDDLGEVCVNFGCINASIDAFANDPTILAACHDARINIVQVMGAQNMSNRFYTVHPRRNDRFLRASIVLQALYPEVDFSDFCFTRHMLGALYAVSSDRFDIVRRELEEAWVARMTRFLTEIGSHVYLFWFAERLPSDAPWDSRADPFRSDPLFVTRRMVNCLRPLVRGVIMVQPSSRAVARGTDGMVFSPVQASAAAEALSITAHQEAAAALSGAIRAERG